VSTAFVRDFVVGWADLDANAHMRNTAYLDRCVDVRMMYFAARGLQVSEFGRRRIGPVIRRDEVDYFRELVLLDTFSVDLSLAGASADGSRFRLVSELTRAGERVARVTSSGGWLDLDARRLVAPPQDLRALFETMPRTLDFEELRSSVRARGPV
jgi:acyl-CoA thioester hydrolase